MKALLSFLAILPTFLFAQDYEELWVEHDDIQHYVRIFGEGDPILLINGGPGMNSNGFEGLASHLAENHSVIIYDQRGTGLSPMEEPSNRNITLSLMAGDIEAIREELEIDEWIVMGHSFGGIMAYYYASRYPLRVKAMIQSSSGGMDLALRGNIILEDRLTEVQRDSLSYFTNLVNNGHDEFDQNRRYYMALGYLYNDDFAWQIANRLAEADLDINRIVWNNMSDINYDVKEEMLTFQPPVLILQGEYDILEISIAEMAHEILPDSRLEIISDAGHYGWIENPDEYYGAIESFLEELEE